MIAHHTDRRRLPAVAAARFAFVLAAVPFWHLAHASVTAHAQARSPEAVPVAAVAVLRQDVPLYLSGLGTVRASSTVAIQPQVDGKLLTTPFTEGQFVRKGDLIARIDPSLYQAALDQAVARKAQHAAELAMAEKDLARARQLVAQSVDTAQLLDQRQGKVDELRALIAADDAEVATARTLLARTDILAPGNGRLGIRQIDPGNIVRASDKATIVTLTDIRPADVVFTLPAKYLDDVRDAMRAGPLTVTAFDQDNRRTLAEGKLLLIDNVIDQATATIRLKAMFANEDDRLWPGEFVNARLLLGTRRGALTIPAAAVQRGPQGLFAWFVTAEGRAQMRDITVDTAFGPSTIVLSGLAEGDRVVVDGQLKLRPDTPVSVNAGTR